MTVDLSQVKPGDYIRLKSGFPALTKGGVYCVIEIKHKTNCVLIHDDKEPIMLHRDNFTLYEVSKTEEITQIYDPKPDINNPLSGIF